MLYLGTKTLTELPPLPEKEDLIAQEWNWSLEDIKNNYQNRERRISSI